MNYRIRVGIKIIECCKTQSEDISNPVPGIYEQVISQEQKERKDEGEWKLMGMSYEAMRTSFSVHLSQASQKMAEQLRAEEQRVEVRPYRVDGEIGCLKFEAYYVDTPTGLCG